MARSLRIEYSGAFYHVTSRGNERKTIFSDAWDLEKFLSFLESAVERHGALVHAYSLMGNHYHLLLETPNANLSRIMRDINSSYSTYFNVKWKRTGHLFQGRYKAILVESDAYAAELSRYIHLNPVRAKMCEAPEEYPWMSYKFYTEGNEPSWLTTGFILGYCIFGFVAGLVLLVLAVAVGGVLIVMKQRKGLHSKKSDNGIFIYAYSKKV